MCVYAPQRQRQLQDHYACIYRERIIFITHRRTQSTIIHDIMYIHIYVYIHMFLYASQRQRQLQDHYTYTCMHIYSYVMYAPQRRRQLQDHYKYIIYIHTHVYIHMLYTFIYLCTHRRDVCSFGIISSNGTHDEDEVDKIEHHLGNTLHHHT